MNDLQDLATLLAKPEPPREAVDNGRHKLQNAMLHPSPARKHKKAWLAGGLGLTATAAATAAAIVLVSSGTGAPHTPNSPPDRQMSARQVLLAAATTAETLPDEGIYWHITLEERPRPGAAPETTERWIKRDGRVWFKGKKSDGQLTQIGDQRWGIGPLSVSLDQLLRLPTTPDDLKGWITDAVKRSDLRTSAGRFTAAQQKQGVFQGLVSLISTLPTTSKTRAAAFRAIASYPNVKSTGKAPGGQGLQFPSETGDTVRMVIDPATSQLRHTNVLVWIDGGEWSTSGTYTLTTTWTNVQPR
ncbi:CU044_5270 family protein [Actinomadura sp. 6N118]|uniref:CU044_5270 family protein n=1 Tax=Actinomadura sp. 6N118 TaxID=3375151 RepID=UPI0037963673